MTTDPIEVPDPDLGAAAASADRRRNLTPGALGEFGAVADTLAALRRSLDPPIAPKSVRLTVFAGDHGIAAHDVSADLPEATGHRAADLAAGRGLTAVLADRAGVEVTVIDVAIDSEDELPGVTSAKIRRSSGRTDIEDGLTQQQVALAIQAGRDAATAAVGSGADLLIGALCGVGAGTTAAAIGSYLTGVEPVDAAGRGTGVDDDGWIRRVTAVRDVRYRLTVGSSDAATLLRVAGGADLAALTGFVLEAALHGVPVLLDDLPGAVAAVLAHRFAPGAERYVLVPAPGRDLLHQRLLELINTPPLTGLRLGAGMAAPSLLVVPLLGMITAATDAAGAPAGDRAPWAIDEWASELL